MALQPSSVGGRFELSVDGVPVGSLRSFGGLGAAGNIVQSAPGSPTPKKQMTGFQWTPGRGSVGIGMGKPMANWIKASLERNNVSHNGAFKSADFNGKVRSVRSFTNAVLTEFTVPSLDGSSKDAGTFDFAFEAEQVTWGPGNGEALNPVNPRQKSWVTSNFSIAIGDLPCARVAKVDSFTWRCAVVGNSGLGRPNLGTATIRAEVPDLTLTISAADYPAWQAAAKKWFIDGACLEANEMTGRITLLAPTMKDELGAIDLFNVGFKSFDHEVATSGADQLGRFTVVLYVERMSLSIKDPDA